MKEQNTGFDMIIKEAQRFAKEEISPFAGKFDEECAVSPEVIKKIANKGYLGALLPVEYGGLGLDPLYYGYLTEIIGKACPSTRALLTVHCSLVSATLLQWGTEEQKKRWLPKLAKGEKLAAFALTEPTVGTDAKEIRTSYERIGDHYILNGRKKWITYGHYADLFLAFAVQNGKVSAFIVERDCPGVQTVPMKGMMASRGAYVAEIHFDNVRVPMNNIVSKEGNGFSLVANFALDNGRYSIAWAGVALAQAACEAMITYSRKRSQFNKKIIHFQLIQGIIADAITGIHSARALCEKAAMLKKSRSEHAIIETTIAKYFSSQIAMKVTQDAIQVFGGNGCINRYPVERLFREAKTLEIIEGTSQILQEIIAMYGARKYYVADLFDVETL